MTSVAIIGGNSFLAKSLLSELAHNKNIKLKVWAKENTSLLENAQFYPYNFPEKPILPNQLLACDFVLYLAGAGIQPGKTVSNKILYHLNLFEPINLINYLASNFYKGTFISFGSYFEIGINNRVVNFTEGDILKAHNPPFNEYIISKRLLSKFIYDKVNLNCPVRLLHFILPNIYGEDENPHRLIPYLVKSFYQNSTVHLSTGKQVRQYLYIKDISQFLANLCRQECLVGGVFNLGGTEQVSPRNIVTMIQKEATVRGLATPAIAFATAQRADAEAPYLGLDDSQARQQLGWAPRTTLEEILPFYFEKYARETH